MYRCGMCDELLAQADYQQLQLVPVGARRHRIEVASCASCARIVAAYRRLVRLVARPHVTPSC